MSDENTDLTDIKVALARIEERQEASNQAAEHRHKNTKMALESVAMKMTTFATKQELNDRVEPIEKMRDRLLQGSVVGVGAVVAGLAWIGSKFGITVSGG